VYDIYLKYHLVKWVKICKSKKKGGLGIKDLRKMNLGLFCKCWWKLEREEGLWQEIVKSKYLHNKSIVSVTHKQTDSPIWYDLLKVRDIYLQGRGIRFKNGGKTRFWCDPWLYDKSILAVVPALLILCDQKEVSAADVKSGQIQITFRRWLTDDLQSCWDKVCSGVDSFFLQEGEDVIIWKFERALLWYLQITVDC